MAIGMYKGLTKREKWKIEYISGDLERQGNRVLHTVKIPMPGLKDVYSMCFYCVRQDGVLANINFGPDMESFEEYEITRQPVLRSVWRRHAGNTAINATLFSLIYLLTKDEIFALIGFGALTLRDFLRDQYKQRVLREVYKNDTKAWEIYQDFLTADYSQSLQD